MVSMLVSFVVDRGFEPCSGQIKYYEIEICCFSFKHAAFEGVGARHFGSESGYCVQVKRIVKNLYIKSNNFKLKMVCNYYPLNLYFYLVFIYFVYFNRPTMIL